MVESQDIIVAENINTPAQQLKELADKTDDCEVLAAIARNPNTPIDVIVRLAGQCLHQIGHNPALSLLLIENPNFIEDIYHHENFSYYRNHTNAFLPDWFLELAYSHTNYKIREYVALNLKIPVSYLEELSNDDNSYVREAVAWNDNTPIFILEQLATDEQDSVREAVAKHAKAPIFVLEQLATDEQDSVRKKVAKHAKAPIFVLE